MLVVQLIVAPERVMLLADMAWMSGGTAVGVIVGVVVTAGINVDVDVGIRVPVAVPRGATWASLTVSGSVLRLATIHSPRTAMNASCLNTGLSECHRLSCL